MKIPPDADAWDWSLSNTVLAKIHRRRHLTVGAIRKQLGKAPPDKKPSKYGVDWRTLDWSAPSKEIAAALGCPLNLVSQMRGKHAPDTVAAAGGANHYRYTHGRYVGAKAKPRLKTPRTGCNDALRAWIRDTVTPGGKFLSSRAYAALEDAGFKRPKIGNSLSKLRALREITKIESWGGHDGDSVNVRNV